MGKLKLDLDAIEVESFETEKVEGIGTVEAHSMVDETGEITRFGIGCNNSAFPCQSVNACNTDACNWSLQFPRTCNVVSHPNCSLKCTDILQCTTPDMSCAVGC